MYVSLRALRDNAIQELTSTSAFTARTHRASAKYPHALLSSAAGGPLRPWFVSVDGLHEACLGRVATCAWHVHRVMGVYWYSTTGPLVRPLAVTSLVRRAGRLSGRMHSFFTKCYQYLPSKWSGACQDVANNPRSRSLEAPAAAGSVLLALYIQASSVCTHPIHLAASRYILTQGSQPRACSRPDDPHTSPAISTQPPSETRHVFSSEHLAPLFPRRTSFLCTARHPPSPAQPPLPQAQRLY